MTKEVSGSGSLSKERLSLLLRECDYLAREGPQEADEGRKRSSSRWLTKHFFPLCCHAVLHEGGACVRPWVLARDDARAITSDRMRLRALLWETEHEAQANIGDGDTHVRPSDPSVAPS